jgi:hypothetical protein
MRVYILPTAEHLLGKPRKELISTNILRAHNATYIAIVEWSVLAAVPVLSKHATTTISAKFRRAYPELMALVIAGKARLEKVK